LGWFTLPITAYKKGKVSGLEIWFESLNNTPWMLINLVVIAVFILDFPFFFGSQFPDWQIILQAVYVFFVFLWWSTQCYALPYLFQQDQKHLGRAFRNGFLTALAFPIFTLVICGVGLGLSILSVYLLLPLALGVPGLVITLNVHAVNDRLKKTGLRSPEKAPDDEQKNLQ
jgi:amino acid transporter